MGNQVSNDIPSIPRNLENFDIIVSESEILRPLDFPTVIHQGNLRNKVLKQLHKIYDWGSEHWLSQDGPYHSYMNGTIEVVRWPGESEPSVYEIYSNEFVNLGKKRISGPEEPEEEEIIVTNWWE